ncbi:hypothetical protein CDV55_105488 [Aspergillus turcosus]|nr:hypothetical protein CDV55_105488 [Aspergillus turcosus]
MAGSSSTNKSTTSQASFDTTDASSESFLPLQEHEAQIIEELGKKPFTTIPALKKEVESLFQALQGKTTNNQYLVFTDVPKHIHAQLTEKTSRLTKTSRFSSYHNGTLIIKVMPNPEHEVAAGNFDRYINAALDAMGVGQELDALRSTTVEIGDFTKEADASWGPRGRDIVINLVLEIGLFESRPHLSMGIRGWLETPMSTVQVAVLVNINRTQPEIEFRRFELAPRTYHVVIRASPPSAICTQAIRVHRVNGATVVNGGALVLPFQKVVGRAPRTPAEGNITISVAELQFYAEGTIFDFCKKHLREVSQGLGEVVADWNGNVHWSTYRAICRRSGVWKDYNWNRDVAHPMLEYIRSYWIRAFNKETPLHLQIFSLNAKTCLDIFHKNAVSTADESIAQQNNAKLRRTLGTAANSLKHQVDGTELSLRTRQKTANRLFVGVIAAELEGTFWRCANEAGTGMLKRMQALMERDVELNGAEIPRKSAQRVSEELSDILKQTEDKIACMVRATVIGLARDYHTAIIAPQIIKLSKQEMQLKLEVAEAIRKAEQHLILDQLNLGVEDGTWNDTQAAVETGPQA